MKLISWVCIFCLCLLGCNHKAKYDPYAPFASPGGSGDDPSHLVKFVDHLESNVDLDADLLSLEFTDREGALKPLKDYANGKNLVFVMTRGYTGAICPFCSTQVSRLIANYGEFQKRNAEIVVVYPLEKPEDTGKADEFVKRVVSLLATQTELPFPILLDPALKSVEALGIRKDLSKPATYILDSDGRMQFAYVGESLADRPSIKAMVEQLDRMNKLAQRN